MDLTLLTIVFLFLFTNGVTIYLFKKNNDTKSAKQDLINSKQIELLYKQIYFVDSKSLMTEKRVESIEKILATIISSGGSGNETYH
jgi:hypothetical protein